MSQLLVNIEEARGLGAIASAYSTEGKKIVGYYCLIRLDDITYRTSLAATLSPEWGEEHAFLVDGDVNERSLAVSIWQYEGEEKSVVAKTAIPVGNALTHTDRWYELDVMPDKKSVVEKVGRSVDFVEIRLRVSVQRNSLGPALQRSPSPIADIPLAGEGPGSPGDEMVAHKFIEMHEWAIKMIFNFYAASRAQQPYLSPESDKAPRFLGLAEYIQFAKDFSIVPQHLANSKLTETFESAQMAGSARDGGGHASGRLHFAEFTTAIILVALTIYQKPSDSQMNISDKISSLFRIMGSSLGCDEVGTKFGLAEGRLSRSLTTGLDAAKRSVSPSPLKSASFTWNDEDESEKKIEELLGILRSTAGEYSPKGPGLDHSAVSAPDTPASATVGAGSLYTPEKDVVSRSRELATDLSETRKRAEEIIAQENGNKSGSPQRDNRNMNDRSPVHGSLAKDEFVNGGNDWFMNRIRQLEGMLDTEKGKEGHVERLKSENSTLREERDSYQRKSEAVDGIMRAMESRIQELEQRASELECQNVEEREEAARWKSSYDSVYSQVNERENELKESLDIAESTVVEAERRIHELSEIMRIKDAELDVKQQTLEKEESLRRKLQDEISDIKARHVKDMNNLRADELAPARNARALAEEQLDDLLKEREEERAKFLDMEYELHRARNELADTRLLTANGSPKGGAGAGAVSSEKVHDALKAECERLRKENKSLREQAHSRIVNGHASFEEKKISNNATSNITRFGKSCVLYEVVIEGSDVKPAENLPPRKSSLGYDISQKVDPEFSSGYQGEISRQRRKGQKSLKARRRLTQNKYEKAVLPQLVEFSKAAQAKKENALQKESKRRAEHTSSPALEAPNMRRRQTYGFLKQTSMDLTAEEIKMLPASTENSKVSPPEPASSNCSIQ